MKSVPGVRPIPRSILPEYIDSKAPNCSSMIRRAWLGNMTQSNLTRITEVFPTIYPINRDVTLLAMPFTL
ncbi:MAG TPA: hypothetical protein VIY08_15885 [Candidatus Nitrosocosmicus sp.]